MLWLACTYSLSPPILQKDFLGPPIFHQGDLGICHHYSAATQLGSLQPSTAGVSLEGSLGGPGLIPWHYCVPPMGAQCETGAGRVLLPVQICVSASCTGDCADWPAEYSRLCPPGQTAVSPECHYRSQNGWRPTPRPQGTCSGRKRRHEPTCIRLIASCLAAVCPVATVRAQKTLWELLSLALVYKYSILQGEHRKPHQEICNGPRVCFDLGSCKMNQRPRRVENNEIPKTLNIFQWISMYRGEQVWE